MVLHILRALFILLMAAVGYYFISQPVEFMGAATWLAMGISLALGVLLVCIDILSPRKKLALFSGTFFGLIVGIAIAYALSFVVRLLVDQWVISPTRETVAAFVNMLVGVSSCYLAISFILQSKDDFRFVVPYVEFSKQTKGARPMLLDTSVLIDGRIDDIASTGLIESQLIVPRFVLNELQAVADSGDKLKRNRGRRGLEVLGKLQSNPKAEVILYDWAGHDDAEDVDQRLMLLARELNGRVVTNDFNLNKVAQLRGVVVVNINELANALKPVVLPGEKMSVRIIKPGEAAGQGVGYLEDGTMVVVEQARGQVGEEVELLVTSALQTSAGRMIFGRLPEGHGGSNGGGSGGSGGGEGRGASGGEGRSGSGGGGSGGGGRRHRHRTDGPAGV